MSKRRNAVTVKVTSPCNEDWNAMIGDDLMRFCSHCAKHVNDISRLRRKDALRLVKRSQGNVCVRYAVDPRTGGPVFADSLYQITRRAPALAAGVVGASLGLTTAAYAQGNARVTARDAERTETAAPSSAAKPDAAPEQKSVGRIIGTVFDPVGAVVPGVSISVRNTNTNAMTTVSTGEDGTFAFDRLPAGRYSLTTKKLPGFEERSIRVLEVYDGGETLEMITLEPEVRQIMGAVAFSREVVYRNPLMLAVENEEIEEVLALLGGGASPNEAESDGRTPIFAAVESAEIEIVRALITFGADLNYRDEKKRTPIMVLDDEASVELVDLLLGSGAKIDASDEDERTVLMWAAENATAEVVKLFIEAKADVNARDKKGWTALMLAAYEDDIEKVRALLLAGAEVNAKNEDGETAWDQTTDEEVEALLVSFGAIVDDDDVDDAEETDDDSDEDDGDDEPFR